MTLSISDTQHNNTPLSHYTECHILFIIKLSVVLLNVVMLTVITPFSHLRNKLERLIVVHSFSNSTKVHYSKTVV